MGVINRRGREKEDFSTARAVPPCGPDRVVQPRADILQSARMHGLQDRTRLIGSPDHRNTWRFIWKREIFSWLHGARDPSDRRRRAEENRGQDLITVCEMLSYLIFSLVGFASPWTRNHRAIRRCRLAASGWCRIEFFSSVAPPRLERAVCAGSCLEKESTVVV